MGKAIERILLPVIRKQFPEIVDIHLPFEGVFHNLIIVAIRKAYPGHARKVMHGIWGLGQAMFSKCILVVDDTVNIQDLRNGLGGPEPHRSAAGHGVRAGPRGQPGPRVRISGSKMGVDATRKWPGEGFTRPGPKERRHEPGDPGPRRRVGALLALIRRRARNGRSPRIHWRRTMTRRALIAFVLLTMTPLALVAQEPTEGNPPSLAELIDNLANAQHRGSFFRDRCVYFQRLYVERLARSARRKGACDESFYQRLSVAEVGADKNRKSSPGWCRTRTAAQTQVGFRFQPERVRRAPLPRAVVLSPPGAERPV